MSIARQYGLSGSKKAKAKTVALEPVKAGAVKAGVSRETGVRRKREAIAEKSSEPAPPVSEDGKAGTFLVFGVPPSMAERLEVERAARGLRSRNATVLELLDEGLKAGEKGRLTE